MKNLKKMVCETGSSLGVGYLWRRY